MHRYDVTADIYEERYCEEQHRKHHRALQEANVAGKIILDVGCGSGLFFSQAAEQAKFVVGVDVSSKLLKKAYLQAKKQENVVLVRADADHLPFRSGVFDAAFAFTVLQNLPKPIQTLDEIKRTVTDDGKVAVTGLKKYFSLEKFMDILDASGLRIAWFLDEEVVNCYIAVLTA
jgi:ubiquinone/menaquinone biosynthesis C-methylase UbiE